MLCPFCKHDETQVKDSRSAEDGDAIRRRRHCVSCKQRFTTFERVQLREIMVIKKSGRRSPFDRDKLERSFQIALRKRDVDPDHMQTVINGIVRDLESLPEADVASKVVGELVMQGLAKLDQVAYVRYASVYRNFREAKDFEDFVEKELGE